MVKNPPFDAEDTGSIPGLGTKGPRAARQLSRCATTAEPTQPWARVPQLESPGTTRAPARRSEESKARHSQIHYIWKKIKKKKA